MSGFDSAHIFNKQGVFAVTDPNANEVTRRGTKQGAIVSGESIDRWGNIYTSPVPIGYLNFPTTLPTHKLTWTSNNQVLGGNFALSASVSATNGAIGCLPGFTIEYSGVLSGDGTRNLVVAGPSTNLGGSVTGGGTVRWSGASTFAGVNTVESGAKLVVTATGVIPATTISTGATLSADGNTTGAGARAITFQAGTNYNVQAINSTTMSKLSFLNASLGKYVTTNATTNPTMNIDAGLDLNDGSYNILAHTGNTTIPYPQIVSATAPLFTNTGVVGTSTLSTGTAGLEIIGHQDGSYLCKNIAGYFQDRFNFFTALDGEVKSQNASMNTTQGTGGAFSAVVVVKPGKTWTYSGVASPMTAGGTTTANLMVQGGGVWKFTGVNTMNIFMNVVAGTGIGAGGSTAAKWQYPIVMLGATSRLVVTPTIGGLSCGKITIGNVFTATSGFTVDIEGPMLNSTFDLLVQTGTSTPIPTVGVNLSGRTPSFAWVNKVLKMTLA